MPKAKKSLGQNFLIDPAITNQILQFIDPHSKDHFLEIGPGKGAITHQLMGKVDTTHAVEIDRELFNKLKSLEEEKNFYVHNKSILDFDPRGISTNKVRVIGNLPYNLSTPIMFWSFKYLANFCDMHFMLQKEFGDRLIAKNDDKNFGRITVITQYLTRPEYCFLISPESFSPKPKIDSVFIRFNPIKGRSIDDPIAIKLQEVTRIAFMHKRKMVGKSLEKIISSKELDDLGIDRKCRPENISVEDYLKISGALI